MRGTTTKFLAVLTALALVLVLPCAAFGDPTTAGEEAESYAILAGDTDIEKATDALAEAHANLDVAIAKVDELQAQIDEIEAQIPDQQARSDAGIKQRYIMQSNPLVIIDSLISAETLGDFLRQTNYLEIISRSNLQELNRLSEMKASLDTARAEQEQVRANAEFVLNTAESALHELQEARDKAQTDGINEAMKQASEQGGEKSVGVAYDGGEQPKDYKEAATEKTEDLSDGADWYADRDAFIAEWAPRIDAYLQGSALEGQGTNFAAAAWKHGVDPRWSPAISNTESLKGAVCIRPHNAWGWGAADSDPYGLAFEWKSWEEAIDAHVAGLAKGFGYTISMNGAKKYCPNTWQSWYNKTLAQMAQI